MEFLKPFLVEVTEELLYNIVYNVSEVPVDYGTLSTEFKKKTGHHPMEFFGFGNVTEQEWPDFIKNIPGLTEYRGDRVCINDNINENEDKRASVYRQNNNTSTKFGSCFGQRQQLLTVAAYREEFLILSCKMIGPHYFANLGGYCQDNKGNTPLHFVAALPGHYLQNVSQFSVTLPLVKNLLRIGINPLTLNCTSQNFLHTITCAFEEEEETFYVGDDEEYPSFVYASEPFSHYFTNGNATYFHQYVRERIAVIDLLSTELTPEQQTLLVNAQDCWGNTVMHEWAKIISMLCVDDYDPFDRKNILEKLVNELGAGLRLQNDKEEVALHHAFHPTIFRTLLEIKGWMNKPLCRTRNSHDETTVFSMLKRLVGFAFVGTSVFKELSDLCFLGIKHNESVTVSIEKAITMLQEFTYLVAKKQEVRKTLWISDEKGNCIVDIILIAIRLGSYHLEQSTVVLDYIELRKCLVELLSQILQHGNANDMKQRNSKGQSALHVLLDMGEGNINTVINDDHILQSVEILLKHNADVNAVDSEGRTPLDVSYKYYDRRPSLYMKCAELLIHHEVHVVPPGINASSPATSRLSQSSSVQPSLLQGITSLSLNERRKLRGSCPKSHLNNANRLIDINSEVTVVGRYRYSSQDPIGSGAFSSIFVAVKDENEDNKSGTINCRAYALKRMEKAKMNANEFRREISTLLSISGQCENIIKYYESVEDDFFHYLSLDLMDGDMHEFVRNDYANKVLKDPVLRVQVTKEIINGLAFVHEQKFIHRDLKLGNILYTTDPALHFKIADFGLTKNMSTSSKMISSRGSGVAMAPGTRCWMAPELISMESREHTLQSDIFSLGLVLHYLLTLGKHPFNATESEEPAHVIEQRIVQTQVTLAFYPEAASFFQMLLSKDPLKRPPVNVLHQHPFFWNERKKIEFLTAVGNQPEAASPTKHPNSQLEQRLQVTNIGRKVQPVQGGSAWNLVNLQMDALFAESRRQKYRTDKVIDLLRFIRNAYAHKQERSPVAQGYLDRNIFLQTYPSLVLDVFSVVQDLGFLNDPNRKNIQQALTANV
ncbi:serine threonine- kinase endoribonuclease IRE1-like [Paramuricea clavata]|uniref:Serine threonine- kinase endoribonuclease IRE1-like n=1 Tax=Paramuricea clavata TaxID=317549 RepID=A0A6S7H591_PARCT|nr:serine threonine- kinase endoribonuclease IRE1-like [Paramuricea clavata]